LVFPFAIEFLPSLNSPTVRSHRFAAPFIIYLLSEIFGVPFRLHEETSTGDKTDDTPASRLAEHPVVAEVPIKAPHASNDMQAMAAVKDNTGSDTGKCFSFAAWSVIDNHFERRKRDVMNDETRRFSLGIWKSSC
jgi:hypothetical protein